MTLAIQRTKKAESRAVERVLKKMRCDSKWRGLSLEQCQQAERWLFEDNLGYKETASRVKEEFGVDATIWSVQRFYRNRARMRRSIELLEAQVASNQLSAIPANTGDMRATTMKLVAKSAIQLATEKPDALAQLLPVAKLLLESQETEIRLRRVELEERYYDFEANAACARDLERVRSYLKTVGDNESLSDAEKHQRVVELLFGKGKINVTEAEWAESEENKSKTVIEDQKRAKKDEK